MSRALRRRGATLTMQDGDLVIIYEHATTVRPSLLVLGWAARDDGRWAWRPVVAAAQLSSEHFRDVLLDVIPPLARGEPSITNDFIEQRRGRADARVRRPAGQETRRLSRPSLGAAWADFDGDVPTSTGVVNSGQANELFENDGAGAGHRMMSSPCPHATSVQDIHRAVSGAAFGRGTFDLGLRVANERLGQQLYRGFWRSHSRYCVARSLRKLLWASA